MCIGNFHCFYLFSWGNKTFNHSIFNRIYCSNVFVTWCNKQKVVKAVVFNNRKRIVKFNNFDACLINLIPFTKGTVMWHTCYCLWIRWDYAVDSIDMTKKWWFNISILIMNTNKTIFITSVYIFIWIAKCSNESACCMFVQTFTIENMSWGVIYNIHLAVVVKLDFVIWGPLDAYFFS